jgi:hypothetical protein
VLYLHADHFEPSNTSDLKRVDAVLSSMISDVKKSSFKPSLFLKIPSSPQWKDSILSFKKGSSHSVVMERSKELADLGCDMHLHVHHERWTDTDVTNDEFKEPLSKGLITNSEVFEFFIQTAMNEFKKYGLSTTDWGFVHGCWSLNASDFTMCKITDEVMILRKYGCIGDFTFPAGRTHCNPSSIGIFVIKPENKVKCYDIGKTIARGTNLLADPDAFIICYPTTSYYYASLDNLVLRAGIKSNLHHTMIDKNNVYISEDPLKIIEEWLLSSCIVDHTLIIKTHSHNMRLSWWQDEHGNVLNNSPLFSKKHKERLGLLQHMCGQMGVGFEAITVREFVSFIRWVDSGKFAKDWSRL